MRSVLRSVKKRKKSRRLGEPEVIDREDYGGFELDAKVELIRALVPVPSIYSIRGDSGTGAAVFQTAGIDRGMRSSSE